MLRLVGETDAVLIQTRWKDRDGEPRMVEASHLSSTQIAPADTTDESADEASADA